MSLYMRWPHSSVCGQDTTVLHPSWPLRTRGILEWKRALQRPLCVHLPHFDAQRHLNWRVWRTSIVFLWDDTVGNVFSSIDFEAPWSSRHLIHELCVPLAVFGQSVQCADW